MDTKNIFPHCFSPHGIVLFITATILLSPKSPEKNAQRYRVMPVNVLASFLGKYVFLSIQYAKTAHLQVKLPPSLKRVSGPQGSNQELCVAHKGK